MFTHFLSEYRKREPGGEKTSRGCYLWVWMPADDDGHGARTAVTQDRVDLVERHAVHGGVPDLHDLVATPGKAHKEAVGELTDVVFGCSPP